MAKKTWTFKLQDGTHTVVLEHGTISGKRAIFIDENKLDLPPSEARQFMDSGSTHTFQVSGHDCLVVISTNGITFSYDFILDGKSLETGENYSLDPSKAETEARKQRIAVIVVFLIIGFGSLWFNWHIAINEGWYIPFLALIAPAVIVIAIYYIINPEDPTVLPNPIPFRLWVAIILAFSLGFINQYLMDTEYFVEIFEILSSIFN